MFLAKRNHIVVYTIQSGSNIASSIYIVFLYTVVYICWKAYFFLFPNKNLSPKWIGLETGFNIKLQV